MTLFIACLLLYEFHYDRPWYALAVIIWLIRTSYYRIDSK